MPQSRLTATVIGTMTCCLFLAASLVAPESAHAQKKADKTEPVGVIKATIFIGEFE